MPDTGENTSPLFAAALDSIKKESNENQEEIVITLPPGRYDFYPEGAAEREYYISNHDQDNPKLVGLPFEGMRNVVFDGQDSELIFHGRMLPVSLVRSTNCTLENFHIDFENPHISQVKILENDTIAGSIVYEVAPWVEYEIRDSAFVSKGEGWEHVSRSGIAFEGETKRLVYQSGDIRVGSRNVAELSPRVIKAFQWDDKRLIPGTVVAMRGSGRPAPGIFITYCTNTVLENIRIHYAEGMGVLAQMSEDITLDQVSVCLRGKDDPRYFTAQADATHFSGCKGTIVSRKGVYENMMDDAINVHGTYLKITERVDDHTLIARYMHGQSYGFDWGYPGDTIRFIRSKTMDHLDGLNVISAIQATDKPDSHGAKEFRISFEKPLEPAIHENENWGIENLEWTPKVDFRSNLVRNNRARGALFSTPKPILIFDNTFDHTSGTAILLCGDCNGWYETGACKDVYICANVFKNSLTSMFQFTNAIISIYPVIPDLENQEKYFHSGITIKRNIFATFDAPILYAKSVNGLEFLNNHIFKNSDYPAFHWNKEPFLFERVVNYVIDDNHLHDMDKHKKKQEQEQEQDSSADDGENE